MSLSQVHQLDASIVCVHAQHVYDCTSIRYVHACVIDVQYMHVKFTTFYTYQAKTLFQKLIVTEMSHTVLET